MKIYRVEMRMSIVQFDEEISKATNIGPYSCSVSNMPHVGKSCRSLKTEGWTNFRHFRQTAERHPAPQEDDLLMNSMLKNNERFAIREFHFGFPSVLHFRRWFDLESREDMQAAGFVLAEYDVPIGEGHIGKSQATFRLDKATLVQYHEILEV